MNYRDALILPNEEQSAASGTKVIKLDIAKPISRIVIRFRTTRKLGPMDDAAPANIPKIELVDGSTVLHSLTGRENQALAYYSRPHAVMEEGTHIATLTETDFYALDFGRYLWDEQLAFLVSHFDNPQLKITYNEALSDTTATENALEVWARIFDDKVISPLGFLMPVEHYAYTPGASGSYETIVLPEDRPIRQILVRAHSAGYAPWYTITEARLDEGTMDRVPWEYTDLEQYYLKMKGTWGKIITDFQCDLTAVERALYIPQCDYNATLAGVFHDTARIAFANGYYPAVGGKALLTADGNGQFIGQAFGYLPWHCYQFPLGKQDVIEDWYDPAGKKPRLRLRASTGATPTCQVVLEELYRY